MTLPPREFVKRENSKYVFFSFQTYDGDVKDMELDFTMVSEEIGKTQVEELKPNGSSILVTNDNRIEYIHLVADYKLNRQIRSQCSAFRYLLNG